MQEIHLKDVALDQAKLVCPVEIGKFYKNSLAMKYKCLGFDGRLIRWMLLNSFQHGQTIDVEFLQDVMYSGDYEIMTDSGEIAGLEARYLNLVGEHT